MMMYKATDGNITINLGYYKNYEDAFRYCKDTYGNGWSIYAVGFDRRTNKGFCLRML